MSNYGPVSTSVDGQFERRCANCGKRFRTDHPHQRYCSNRCKRSAQNRRYYRRRRRVTAAMRLANEMTNFGRHEPSLL